MHWINPFHLSPGVNARSSTPVRLAVVCLTHTQTARKNLIALTNLNLQIYLRKVEYYSIAGLTTFAPFDR